MFHGIVKAKAFIVGSLVAMSATTAGATQLFIDPIFGSSENTGAIATITLSFSEDGSDDLMSVLMDNTTDISLGATLTDLAMELPPSLPNDPIFSVGGMDAYFDTLSYDVNVSPASLNAPGGYDLLISADGNFEGGNAKGGPTAGQSAMVTLSLGDTGLSPLQLDDLFLDFYTNATDNVMAARFLQVGEDGEFSDKVLGQVPEPASLSLLALGAMLVARRKRCA